MAVVMFDTHQFIQTLRDAGFEERKAEAISNALKSAQRESDIATKGDLSESEGGFKSEINQLRHELRETETRLDAKIETSKSDMIKWVAGLLLAQAGLVTALVKLL